MKNKQDLREFKNLISLFEEDLGKSLDMAKVDLNRLFLSGITDDFKHQNELMLRLNKFNKKLIIARIEFVHQRAGFGARLLKLLKDYARDNEYEIIQFESVLSEPMQAFVIKHGFELASNYELELNWELKI